MKQVRYYEIDGDTAYVYDAPYPSHANCASIVPTAQLAYYRQQFILQKCWKDA